jgi:hypothetical protein
VARGLTLDTGALVALEARRQRIRLRLKLANEERKRRISVKSSWVAASIRAACTAMASAS